MTPFFNLLFLRLHLPPLIFLISSSFRRGDDTSGEARLRSDWNKHVMKDIIAPLYALLLVYACKYLQELILTTSADAGAIGDGTADECSTISEVRMHFHRFLRLTRLVQYFTFLSEALF